MIVSKWTRSLGDQVLGTSSSELGMDFFGMERLNENRTTDENPEINLTISYILFEQISTCTTC